MLQSMGWQRVRQDLATEHQQQYSKSPGAEQCLECELKAQKQTCCTYCSNPSSAPFNPRPPIRGHGEGQEKICTNRDVDLEDVHSLGQ